MVIPRLHVFPLILALAALNGAAEGSDSDDTEPVPADTAPVVIMAPEGPVFAEVRISVDGRPYRTWVTEFLADKTDANRDGRLSMTELGLIPTRLLQQTSARTAQRAMKRSTGLKNATSVPLRKFTSWFARDLGQSFNVIAGAVQASEAVRLASLIDSNGDGSVSREELATGTYALRFRDLDDDQTFSASELLPFRDPRNQQAAVVPDAADLPFVQLADDEAVKRAAKQIVTRYGQDGSVSKAAFRLPELVAAELPDALSESECHKFLKAPFWHLTIEILLSDKPNRSDVRIRIPETSRELCAVKPDRRGRARLIVGEMPIEVRARGGAVRARSFLTSFVLQYFSITDGDKNGYLTADEFPGLQQRMAQQGMPVEFSDADLNGDEMLFRNEVEMFIERDAIATQSRIEVSVRQDGKTLFKILDRNNDRRLSHRELLQGFDALLEFDLNEDDRITESELGTAYVLEIGLGQAESLRMDAMMQNANMGMQSTDAILPGVDGLEGPEWFRRMDRNQDRDVSVREFLGPRSIFDDLDSDKDGLLSASEAEAL